MGDYRPAQAVELVRALRHQLHAMTRQLAQLERQGVTGTNGRASAIRREAAALRLDISEAQFLIDGLEAPVSERAAATPSRAQETVVGLKLKPGLPGLGGCR